MYPHRNIYMEQYIGGSVRATQESGARKRRGAGRENAHDTVIKLFEPSPTSSDNQANQAKSPKRRPSERTARIVPVLESLKLLDKRPDPGIFRFPLSMSSLFVSLLQFRKASVLPVAPAKSGKSPKLPGSGS